MRIASLSSASSRLVTVSAAAALLATACTDDYEIPPPPPTRVMSLTELLTPEAKASVVRPATGTTLTLDIVLGYAGDSFPFDDGLRDSKGRFCPTMTDDFLIALDGVPLSSSSGGWRPNGLDEGYYCFHPRAKVEVLREGQTADRVVTISDASRTITFPLGDMLVPR